MVSGIHEEINSLELEIVNEEDKINQAIKDGNTAAVKKGLAVIDADIRYLSIIANGAPIDKKEDLRIRKFLITHFENKRKLSLFA